MNVKGISWKLIPILKTVVTEIANISWVGLIMMLAIGGMLWMFGNEYAAKKLLRNALYGFFIIQIANMIL